MVQKEVKKKTSIYASVAVLSAIVLVSMVYVLGTVPLTLPPSNTPTVLGMKTFSSTDELKNFLTTNANGESNYGGGPLDQIFWGRTGSSLTAAPTAQGATGATGATGAKSPGDFSAESTNGISDSYSTTNIQVAGVDEPDTIKNDGRYIYTVTTPQNVGLYYYGYYSQPSSTIDIVNADPQNAQVVSKIDLGNESQPAGMFLSADGNKLVVLASKYETYYAYDTRGTEPAFSSLPYYHSDVYTYINVYDVTNKANPVLSRNFTASGSYFDSRMIGNDVYIIVSQPAQIYNNVVVLPAVYEGNTKSEIAAPSIYYVDSNQSSYYTFTSFYGLDISNSALPLTNMTVMMDGTSNMYVSPSNIYVTYPTWDNNGSFTSIYRVSINRLQLALEAKGNVPGNILNQYSMDEYNGNFRIATNWYNYGTTTNVKSPEGISSSSSTTSQPSQLNNVYILNQDLTVVGKLEGLAQGENLHSVRFMGDKAYLVTFKRTDPLFVIDLSVANNPKVLGELKIPGYSDYLHPYDATHLIGVGKEAEDIATEDFAYYQGVKLALFDVSNVNSPTQIDNYVIGDRGSDTPVLYEPKAFLFDKSKNLLVIPVSVAIVANKTSAADYGQTVWQGAYVFTLTTSGFTLKGNVTHINATLLNSQGQLIDPNNYWETQNDWINRSLYIGNTLYTISNDHIKLNSLTDLSQTAVVNL
jgi:inhibitor of cysteine peptidase